MSRSNEDYKTAQTYYETALSISRQASIKPLVQMACVNLSAVTCALEDYAASSVYGLETLKLAEEAGDKLGIGFALERFLALAVIYGEQEKAVCLFGALENIYESVGYKIEGVDEIFLNRYLDQARTAIGEENYNHAKTKGSELSLADAIALARENESDWQSDSAKKKLRITNEADFDTKVYSTNDALEAQTAKIPDVSRPHFLSQIGRKAFL